MGWARIPAINDPDSADYLHTNDAIVVKDVGEPRPRLQNKILPVVAIDNLEGTTGNHVLPVARGLGVLAAPLEFKT